MPNIDDKNATTTDYTYPIRNFVVRQGHSNAIITLRLQDSENGPFKTINDSDFVGSIAVAQPTGKETSKSAQLEFVQNADDSDIVYVHVPTDFSNGLNPDVNRPVKCYYDIWQSDDGETATGSGVIGGTINIRERIARNSKVGSTDISTL